MHAKCLFIYESRERQVVENFGAVSPNIYTAVLTKTFVVKSIDLCDLARLVVASNERHAVGIAGIKPRL